MQVVPGYTAAGDSFEPSALVTVNGVPVDVESVTVTREITAVLPEQVTARSGMSAATGSVSWVASGDVQVRASHPWDGNSFPPKPGDSVVAFMGYGDILVRQLTGKVDLSSGSIASGDVQSDIVDPIDKLDQPVTFGPHMAVMPPHVDGGSLLYVAAEPTYFTDRTLRACGFNATPARAPGCVVSVPLMGSSWPERGRVVASSRQGAADASPMFRTSHWGLSAESINATYTPDLWGFSNGRLDKTFQMTLKMRRVAGTSGTSYIRARWGVAQLLLVVNPDRRVTAQIFDGGSFTVCQLTATQVDSSDIVTMRVTPDGVFSLYAGNGATATGTRALPAAMTGADLTSVDIVTPHLTGVSIGGVQVGFTTSATWMAEQTATLSPSAYPTGLQAFPRVEKRNALDLLKEQAEAECAAWWLDEFGYFQWRNRKELVLRDPVATLTAFDDVFDIGWESDARGVRARVVLSSREPIINRSGFYGLTAWQGSGETLDSGQESVQFVAPDADTDWVGVDESMSMATTTAEWPQGFNWGRGSWAGGVYTKDDEETWASPGAGFSSVMEKVGPFGYKITTKAGTAPAGYSLELRTRSVVDASTLLYKGKRGFNLPVLRSMTVIDWLDETTTSTVVGPDSAAVLEHDIGPWIHQTSRQSHADWLAGEVSGPRPVLRDLSVFPDFRRQLGDIVWVEDPDNMRVKLKVLVTKVSNTVSAGEASQSVAGMILEVLSYGVTNAQLDSHAGKFTNTGFDTLWASGTNAELDANPLGRG